MKESKFQTELYVTIDNKKVRYSKNKIHGNLYYVKPDRTKVVIPFRSFVKEFMDLLEKVFSVSAVQIGTDKVPLTVNLTSASSDRGILLYSSTSDIKDPSDAWGTSVSSYVVRSSLTYNIPIMPTGITKTLNGDNVGGTFKITRVIVNNSTTTSANARDILVVGKYISGTASGRKLLSRDTENISIPPLSSVGIEFGMSFSRSLTTGGEKLNLLQLILNTMFGNNANPLNKMLSHSSGMITYSIGAGANHYYIDAGIDEYYGILVGEKYNGFVQTGDPGIDNTVTNVIDVDSDGQYEMTVHTGLGANGYGAVTVGSSTLTSTGASITVSRVITNNSTVSKKIERIALYSKGATAGTSGINSGSACLMMNAVDIVLAPSQSMTVQYVFKVTT